jgi:hypothetical protein
MIQLKHKISLNCGGIKLMRATRQFINLMRYAMTNKTVVLAAFILSIAATTGVGLYKINQQSAMAAVQDCSTNSIVKCGVANYAQLTQKYDANEQGDLRAIYDHYFIKRTPAAGDQVIQGWAKNDGTVVANGRVVATNAASIGREPISGSHPISIAGRTYHQTTHVGGQAFKPGTTQLETMIVLDANGNFKYAVINGCGNPIYATPVPPTPPQPKDIQVCELATRKIITIKENQFDATKHSKNPDDCKPKKIQVCNLATKQIITINEDQYDTTKHSKNPDDCKTHQIRVCELASKNIITIDEDEFDTTKYSRNLADCEEEPIVYVKVCDTKLNKIVRVTEEMAQNDRYTTNFDECKKQPEPPVIIIKTPVKPAPVVEAPRELPKTGAVDMLSGGLGLVSVTLAAYYYALSRRW